MAGMDYKVIFGIIASILPFVAYATYLRATWHGKIKPQPISWIIWGSSSVILGAILLNSGGGWAVWTNFSGAALSFLVAILAFTRQSRFTVKIARVDWMCLFFALAALALYIFAKDPLVATILLVLSDVLALIPTIKKVRLAPFSETQTLWWISSLRCAVALAAIAQYNFVTLTSGILSLLVNVVGLVVIIFRQYGFIHSDRQVTEVIKVAEASTWHQK